MTVEGAIEGYLKSLQFNGIFVINELIDLIQAVNGVVDATNDGISGRTNASPAFTIIPRTYQALSGYLEIDPAYPLNATITYVPSNV